MMKSATSTDNKVFVPWIGLMLFVVSWHIVSTYIIPNGSTLPPPWQIARAIASMWRSGELAADIGASLNRILIGFAIALFGALVFGIAAARYARIYRYVSSTMDLLSSIPPIAWTPIAILWFGIGNAPAVFIVFLGAFFPMFTSVYSGINRVDPDLKNAARTLGASSSLVVRGVVFPAALPQTLIGIRTGIGVAWFNVIAAELIGVRSGLGYKIQLYRTLLSSDHVISVMVVIGVLGFLMTTAVGLVGRLATPWAIQDDSRQVWIGRRRVLRSLLRRHSTGLTTPANMLPTTEAVPVNSLAASTASPILKVQNLSLGYDMGPNDGKLEVLRDITFEISRGEVVAILGPNGSGKTTLINVIAGLLRPDAGCVRFLGRQVRNPSHERTVVFQSLALFPWCTCEENIAFALEASAGETATEGGRLARAHDRLSAQAYLANAGLLDFADTYPAELSGGMKQRLALARALAASPQLILMDEPFASFDPLVREASQETMSQLLPRDEATTLLVTHDVDEAVFMADRIVVLSERPATIKAIVTVGFDRPRISALRRDQRFHELRSRVWDLLRSPIMDQRDFLGSSSK